MTYAVKWHPQAFRVFRRLPKQAVRRILFKLDVVAEEPFRYVEHYEGQAVYKLRIGAYRFLLDVDIKEKVLLIQTFDKRGRVYKR
jgi:mRNA-degrading endonuclease RelE of RelBE toxin-antitoxin system